MWPASMKVAVTPGIGSNGRWYGWPIMRSSVATTARSSYSGATGSQSGSSR